MQSVGLSAASGLQKPLPLPKKSPLEPSLTYINSRKLKTGEHQRQQQQQLVVTSFQSESFAPI